MTNTRAISLLLSAAVASASLRCATSARQVGITKNPQLVANCQSVGEVNIGTRVAPDEIDHALANEGRKKDADYVVVHEDGARTGTAYRCANPTISAPR
jgi:hypothetical protein